MDSLFQTSLNEDPLLTFPFISDLELSIDSLLESSNRNVISPNQENSNLLLSNRNVMQGNSENLHLNTFINPFASVMKPFPSPQPETDGERKKNKKDERFWMIDSVEKDKTDNRYHCPICSKTFTRKYNLKSHFASSHISIKAHGCSLCERSFARKYDLKRHVRNIHSSATASTSSTSS